MKRRTTDPLAPLLPLVRVTAVGFVALIATLAAVHVGTIRPVPTAADVGTSTKYAQVAAVEASGLLGEVEVPPGSTRLTSRPSDAPDLDQAPFLPQVSTMVTRTTWWSTALSPVDALGWMRAHPANGLFASISGPSIIGFEGNGSGVIDQITVYAEAFTLPDGTTGIQLSSVVVYQPVRSAQETIPAAAKLVATPRFPGPGGRAGASKTFTNQAEINRVAEIINALPTQPLGIRSCPADTGGILELDFQSSGGAPLAQVVVKASGCAGTYVTANGTQQPALSSGYETLQQIQDILGTRWQLTTMLP